MVIHSLRNKLGPLCNYVSINKINDEDADPRLQELVNNELAKLPQSFEDIMSCIKLMEAIIKNSREFDMFQIPSHNDPAWQAIDGINKFEIDVPHWLKLSNGNIVMGIYRDNGMGGIGWWKVTQKKDEHGVYLVASTTEAWIPKNGYAMPVCVSGI